MTKRATVPCAGCKLCCQNGNVIMLFPEYGDDLSIYDYQVKAIGPDLSGPILKQKPNGDCIYLGEEGCTIHDHAPVVCKVFDCRGWYLSRSRAERRRMVKAGLASQEVFDAGRARLASRLSQPT